MTETQTNDQVENKVSDKELNFRRLEAKYQQEVALERARNEELQRRLQEKEQQPEEIEEEDPEPYVDHKRLEKKLNKFGKNTQAEIKNAMQYAKEAAKEELKQEMFLENHEDFYKVLELSERFAEKHPKLAENILKMPQGFERQKLVYQTIKDLGIDKPEQRPPSIQEKIDANRKGPYYQPAGVGTAPYHSQSDFSAGGQKQAYDKMQELKARLRL